MTKQERVLYYQARKAGLDPEWAQLVAVGECTLDDALGDMDCDAEVGAMLAQVEPWEDRRDTSQDVTLSAVAHENSLMEHVPF